MTPNEFSLGNFPESAFGEQNFYFWVKCVVDGLDLIGPETDSHLENMIQVLLDYYSNADDGPEAVERIKHDTLRLRGTACMRDNSPIGLKYRCLNNLAHSRELNLDDPDYWWRYALQSSFDLINFHDDKDAALIAIIQGNASKLGVDLSNREDPLERDLRNVMVLLKQAEIALRLAETILKHAEDK